MARWQIFGCRNDSIEKNRLTDSFYKHDIICKTIWTPIYCFPTSMFTFKYEVKNNYQDSMVGNRTYFMSYLWYSWQVFHTPFHLAFTWSQSCCSLKSVLTSVFPHMFILIHLYLQTYLMSYALAVWFNGRFLAILANVCSWWETVQRKLNWRSARCYLTRFIRI